MVHVTEDILSSVQLASDLLAVYRPSTRHLTKITTLLPTSILRFEGFDSHCFQSRFRAAVYFCGLRTALRGPRILAALRTLKIWRRVVVSSGRVRSLSVDVTSSRKPFHMSLHDVMVRSRARCRAVDDVEAGAKTKELCTLSSRQGQHAKPRALADTAPLPYRASFIQHKQSRCPLWECRAASMPQCTAHTLAGTCSWLAGAVWLLITHVEYCAAFKHLYSSRRLLMTSSLAAACAESPQVQPSIAASGELQHCISSV